jgi:hypothetical protein
VCPSHANRSVAVVVMNPGVLSTSQQMMLNVLLRIMSYRSKSGWNAIADKPLMDGIF